LLTGPNQADGWDPAHAPDIEKHNADVVNLGYVLNVIEDPAERLSTLAHAWSLTKRLLVVSAMVRGTPIAGTTVGFQDGVLASRNTFQKYFEQQELQQLLEDALERVAVPVALGIFYVFRDTSEQQAFLQARSRRHIDWDNVRLGFDRPQPRERKARVPRIDLFDAHVDLAEPRLPGGKQPPTETELLAVAGGGARGCADVLRHIQSRHG